MLRSIDVLKRNLVPGLFAVVSLSAYADPTLPVSGAAQATAATPQSGAKACFKDLSIFLKEVEERRTQMATRFSRDIKSDSKIRNIGRSLRDSMRRRLQYWNGHPYPILAIDDSPFALGWAKNAVGKLDEASAQLVNVDQIWKELNEQLTNIHNLRVDVTELTDKSVNNAILIHAIESKLADKSLPPFGVTLEVPEFSHDAAGVETQAARTVYYGTITQMELELKTMKATDRALRKTANERALTQAIDVKRLETYRHELIRQQMANPGVTVPKEYDDFMKSVNALYTDETGKTVKDEFNPPAWAWQKLKWQQLTAETKSLYQREIPRLREQKRIKEALDYVKTLTPDEIRALGLQNVATSVERYKNYRWVRLGGALVGLVGVPGGAHFGLKEIIYYFHRDSIEKEKCVGLEAEDAYLDCAEEYLKGKFPGRFYVNSSDLQKLLNEDGEIKDADIKAEIDDIRDRRVQYLYGKNIQDSISGPAKTRLAAEDPSSAEFRQNLISIRDAKAFKAALMNTDMKKGYLMFKYSLAFSKPNIFALVSTVVDAKEPDQQHVLLNSMKNRYPIAAEMAKDLETLLNDHRQYQFDSAEEDRVAKELNVNLDKLLKRDGTGALESGDKHLGMAQQNNSQGKSQTGTDATQPVIPDPSVVPEPEPGTLDSQLIPPAATTQPTAATATPAPANGNKEIPDPKDKE